MNDRVVLFIAQGLGVGRSPFAPGTFGSVLGLGWFVLLLATGQLAVFVGGTMLGFIASVWCCGRAEKILGQPDPGSVVLDEIAAIPLCFAVWVGMLFAQSHALPAPGFFFTGRNLWLTVGIFGAFRLFDIWKPWPVRQSQRLPGGWGVTVDDFLAAAYVSAVTAVVILIISR